MTGQNLPAAQPPASSAVVQHGKYTNEELDVIKATHFKELDDNQIKYALARAERMGLDFFSGDVVAWKGKEGKVEVFTTIAGLRRKAEETQVYFPGRAPTFELDDAGNIVSCVAYVKRWDERTNQWVEIEGIAWWSESAKTTGAWQTHHHSMLAKCAEAFALRRAFASLAGLYINEEKESIVDTDAMKAQDGAARRGAVIKKLEQRNAPAAAEAPAQEAQPVKNLQGETVATVVNQTPSTVTIDTTATVEPPPAAADPASPLTPEGERLKLLADCKAIIEKLSMPKKVVLYKKLGMAMNADLTPCSMETLTIVFDKAVEVRG